LEGSVSEFVILSGPLVHDHLIRVRAELRAYLARFFPQFRFSLAVKDAEGMDFVVVPVVGSTGEDVDLDIPDLVTLAEIRMALEAFAPGRSVFN
jgi:hypothetical protein